MGVSLWFCARAKWVHSIVVSQAEAWHISCDELVEVSKEDCCKFCSVTNKRKIEFTVRNSIVPYAGKASPPRAESLWIHVEGHQKRKHRTHLVRGVQGDMQ